MNEKTPVEHAWFGHELHVFHSVGVGNPLVPRALSIIADAINDSSLIVLSIVHCSTNVAKFTLVQNRVDFVHRAVNNLMIICYNYVLEFVHFGGWIKPECCVLCKQAGWKFTTFFSIVWNFFVLRLTDPLKTFSSCFKFSSNQSWAVCVLFPAMTEFLLVLKRK